MKKIRKLALSAMTFLLLAPSTSALALAPTPFSGLSNPPSEIATAKVVDKAGTTIGAVQKVEMDATGKPIKVDVALLGTQQTVVLDSSSLSYDETNNVVIAGLDKSQIVKLPLAAPPG